MAPGGTTSSRRQFIAFAAATAALAACGRSESAPRGNHAAVRATPTLSATSALAQTHPNAAVHLGREARYQSRVPSQWGTTLPGIRTTVPTQPGSPTLALTFDACGGPQGSGVDTAILETLRKEQIPATLFLNQRWVAGHRQLTSELAAESLFSLGNHGTRHVPLSVTGQAAYGIAGTANANEVVDEVSANQQTLTEITGIRPLWFRAGTAHYDDVAVELATELGVQIAGFSVNGDGGATFTPQQVSDALRTAPDGSIVLMHMNQPSGGTAAGLRAALPKLRDRGIRFVHLPS